MPDYYFLFFICVIFPFVIWFACKNARMNERKRWELKPIIINILDNDKIITLEYNQITELFLNRILEDYELKVKYWMEQIVKGKYSYTTKKGPGEYGEYLMNYLQKENNFLRGNKLIDFLDYDPEWTEENTHLAWIYEKHIADDEYWSSHGAEFKIKCKNIHEKFCILQEKRRKGAKLKGER